MADLNGGPTALRGRSNVSRYTVGGRAVPDDVVEAIHGRMREGPFDLAALVAVALHAVQAHALPRSGAQTLAERVMDAERRKGRIARMGSADGTKRATWTWDGER